jgi:ketosteroid isomerase-like protein
MKITEEFAQEFAQEWVSAFNAHDIERVLSHYTEDFVIKTPVAARLLNLEDGVVAGKENVRAYWTLALEKMPDLHFELLDILIGMDGLTLYYINTGSGKKTAEVMSFNDQGMVYKVAAYYH